MPDLKIERADLDSPAAQALIDALNVELVDRYPEAGANHFRLDLNEVSAGQGAFLIASLDDAPVGCGALRRLNTTEAEIKRMYVTPERRGQGIGRAILNALELEARQLGAVRVVLETGERQPEALALYGRAGFSVIANFGEYVDSPLSVCMAKDLHGTPIPG